jgi:hypothetical protein
MWYPSAKSTFAKNYLRARIYLADMALVYDNNNKFHETLVRERQVDEPE